MERRKKSLIYLDTHCVIWLFDGLLDKFSSSTRKVLSDGDLFISPLVKLELAYIYELKRIKDNPQIIIASLHDSVGLKESSVSFKDIVDMAITLGWTRDPFDRIIVAEAALFKAPLITADKLIRKHYQNSVW